MAPWALAFPRTTRGPKRIVMGSADRGSSRATLEAKSTHLPRPSRHAPFAAAHTAIVTARYGARRCWRATADGGFRNSTWWRPSRTLLVSSTVSSLVRDPASLRPERASAAERLHLSAVASRVGGYFHGPVVCSASDDAITTSALYISDFSGPLASLALPHSPCATLCDDKHKILLLNEPLCVIYSSL
jgi:hypothetical protein